MSYHDRQNQALLRRGVEALEKLVGILSHKDTPTKDSYRRSEEDAKGDLLYTIDWFERSIKFRADLGLPEDYATKVILEDLYRQRDAYVENESRAGLDTARPPLHMKRDPTREIGNPSSDEYNIVEVPKGVGVPYIVVGSTGLYMTKEYADANRKLDSLNDLAKEMYHGE